MNDNAMYLKYSVLMSLYDKEDSAFFEESIKSMLAQTVKPDQIVIVLDGSVNDRLLGVIEKYKSADEALFTIVPIEQNSGLANALNVGLKECRNELVARMDTDDISVPERCEKQLALFMSDMSLDIVGSNIDEFTDDPNNVLSCRKVPSSEDDIKKFSRRRNPFNHPSVMYKKSAIEQAGGYNVARRRAQDFELFVTMINKGAHARNIDESLLKFRANSDSFERRKNWSHCKTYIDIVRGFWKKGYSSFIDYAVVAVGQTAMYIVPKKLMNAAFNKLLRK